MVRGNWQRRVEKTEARRAAAKQRKQKRDNRSACKAMVQSFLSVLDGHADALRQKGETVHVWTDTIPSDSPPLLDMCQDGKSGGKRRNRSGSLGNEAPTRKGRPRSNSTNEAPSSGKKKAHPRSREQEPADEEDVFSPRLCVNQFYQGKCEDLRSKKGTCNLVHYSGKYRTLCSVLKSGKMDSNSSKDDLMLAEASMLEFFLEEGDPIDEGDMDMLYYSALDIFRLSLDSQDERAPSEMLAAALNEKSCSLSSIVYLAIDNVLLFDRYRNGMIISENSFVIKVLGNDSRRMRSSSTISEGENSAAKEEMNSLLPGPILEHILAFLPDVAVATMSLVCQAWNDEIGKASPALWKHLLERRKWPLPGVGTKENMRDRMRDSFMAHYLVVRDINAIKDALGVLTLPRKTAVVGESEMVYQAFSSRRFAPQSPNGCISVEVWSSNQVLVAYSFDCSIRLFKAVDKTGETGNSPRACRELVSVCVDPFRKTKKKQCRLVAMGLDEEMIGCLCHVSGETLFQESFILSVLSRENFLCAGGNKGNDSLAWSELDQGALKVIDIGEAVIHYLLSCEDVDHRLLRLTDFLSDGGEISDVEVLVSQSIVACGYGRFCVEVSISIPEYGNSEDDQSDTTTILLLDRKLILFSSSAGAIVWMGDSNPLDVTLPRHQDLSLACLRHTHPGGSRLACSLVAVSSTSPMMVQTEIEPSGHIQFVRPVEAAEVVRENILNDEWHLDSRHHRPVVVMASEIVTLDILSKDIEGDRKRHRSVLSFYPRNLEEEEAEFGTLVLGGDCEAVRMAKVREEHVIVICRGDSAWKGGDEIAGIDGHWFGDSADDEEQVVYAVVVHTRTRRQIDCICLLESSLGESSSFYDIPIFISSLGDTIGVGVWWKGVVLTGQDVRSVGSRTQTPGTCSPLKNTKRRKKKRQVHKSGKKDGFARGMSLRG